MSNRREIRSALLMVVASVLIPWAGAMGADEPPATPTQDAPMMVGETRTSLQEVFTSEINARARYLEAAKVAAREGYPYVAQLFRACAAAEQVHADRHATAIAWSGDEARAFLQKPAPGATAENLKLAVEFERNEAERLYPALLARARAEHLSEAVRSMNFALAAEREHVRLLASALETMEQRLGPRTLFVCSQCGKTVESLSFRKCPNCFSPARRFARVD